MTDELERTLPSTSSPAELPKLDERRYQRDPGQQNALLGSGGQGSVWRARDTVLVREVALKRSHQREGAAEEAFVDEARLTARLEHPGIVPVHDLGRAADGTPTLVMRRIEGRSLAQHFDDAATLDRRLALVPALLRACHTVAFAHQHGVVHRDLKPQNIMLGAFGETWVLDWGLAVDVARHRPEGIVGSPAYMSPEQALGQVADERSDVWGLGACLYQLLTGTPPVAGSSTDSAVRRASEGQVRPVRELEPGAPGDLVAICAKALSVSRDARYENASGFAKDLEAWLAGRAVSARTYPAWLRVWRFIKAHRVQLAVGALALAALGSAITIEELRVRAQRNEARSFAQELLRDVPRAVGTQRPSVELVSMLASRAEQWLARTDLDREEEVDACALLNQLSSLAFDAQQLDEAERLAQRTLALPPSTRPDIAAPLLACRANALTMLGEVALAREEVGAGLARFAEAKAALDGWPGPPGSSLLLARASLDHSWADWLWERDPREGARLFIEAGELAARVLDEPSSLHAALNYSENAIIALWSLGRRGEARAVAKRFYEAAQPACAVDDNPSRRGCLKAATGLLQLMAWDDDPAYPALLEKTLALEARQREKNPDSAATLYDSMIFAFDRGDLATAHERALTLRARFPGMADDVGALAAAMVGDLATVDDWPEDPEQPAANRLAQALAAVQRGRYAEAATRLHDIERDGLWYQLAWGPHATLTAVPADARVATDAFLRDFTRAYGAADFGAMSAALDAFERALTALH